MMPALNAARIAMEPAGMATAAAGQDAVGQDAKGTGLFGDVLRSAAQGMEQMDAKAQSAVNGLLTGQGVEVHEAMMATQRADITFELALQVRNKAVAAYQQMMNMQF